MFKRPFALGDNDMEFFMFYQGVNYMVTKKKNFSTILFLNPLKENETYAST